MKEFDRLNSQGNEQQNITPELELSRQLWDTCGRLLQERGRTSFSPSAFLNIVVGINKASIEDLLWGSNNKKKFLNEVIMATRAQQRDMRRYVELLQGEGSETPNMITVWGALNFFFPAMEPYFVDVCISPNRSEVNKGFLRLRKSRRGDIMEPQGDKSPLVRPRRWATTEDLRYYQEAINQSSPIEA